MVFKWIVFFKTFLASLLFAYTFSKAGLLVMYSLQKAKKGSAIIFTLLGLICGELIYASIALALLSGAYYVLDSNYETHLLFGSMMLFAIIVSIYRRHEPFDPRYNLGKGHLMGWKEGASLSFKSPSRIVGYLSIFASITLFPAPPNVDIYLITQTSLIVGISTWWLGFSAFICLKRQSISVKNLRKCYIYVPYVLVIVLCCGLLQLYF